MEVYAQPPTPRDGPRHEHAALGPAESVRAFTIVIGLILVALGLVLAWQPVAVHSTSAALAQPASDDARILTQTRTLLPMVMRRSPPLPDPPVLKEISNPGCDGNYTVDWDAAYLADTYELQEDDNDSFASPSTRYSGPNTSFNVTKQPQGTWYYRVRAWNAYGYSVWSATYSVLVGSPPSAPYLQPVDPPGSDGNYCVAWNSVAGADNYELQEDTSSSFPHPTTRYDGPSTSYCIYGQATGTYYYRVKACNVCGCSGWSNTQKVTVPPPTPPTTYVWINNDTGGSVCVQVNGSGCGKKCSSSGYWFYCGFPSGTYYYCAWGCGGSGCWTDYFPAGDVELRFWCSGNGLQRLTARPGG